MSERKAYPTLIKQCGNDFLVFVPDLDIYTEGSSFPDAIAMARDAIGLKGINLKDDSKGVPEASTMEEALDKARNDADEDFNYSDGIMTFVDVDFEAYRNKIRNRAVKKNCTLPYWLCREAEKQGINFSKVLQEALLQRIGMG